MVRVRAERRRSGRCGRVDGGRDGVELDYMLLLGILVVVPVDAVNLVCCFGFRASAHTPSPAKQSGGQWSRRNRSEFENGLSANAWLASNDVARLRIIAMDLAKRVGEWMAAQRCAAASPWGRGRVEVGRVGSVD